MLHLYNRYIRSRLIRIKLPYLTHKELVRGASLCGGLLVVFTLLSGVLSPKEREIRAVTQQVVESRVDIHLKPKSKAVVSELRKMKITSTSLYRGKLSFKSLGKFHIRWYSGGVPYKLTSNLEVDNVSNVTALAPSSISKGTKIYIDGVGIRCVTYGTSRVPKNTILIYSKCRSAVTRTVKTADVYIIS